MRRCCLLTLCLLHLGCGREEPTKQSRVELRSGLEKPKGLKPYPEPPKPLTRPAVPISQDAPEDGPKAEVVKAGSGREEDVGGMCRYDESSVVCWNLVAELDAFFIHGQPAWRIVVERNGSSKDGLQFFPIDPYPMLLG
jgi:hypothetical protein